MLVKLKQFSMVEVEAEAFGDLDKPDLYHEFYSVTSGEPASQSSAPLTGSMVPFGMRLLLAELPQNLNRPHEAVDRLSRVLFVVRKILRGQSDRESVAARLWQRREVQVLHSIVNCAILQKVIFKFPMHSYRCNSKFQNMYPGFFFGHFEKTQANHSKTQ